MSNLQIKSGDSVSVNIGSTAINATKISEPSTRVSISGVIASKPATSSYEHEQVGSSDSWNITHNLGKKPSVTVVDTADTVIFAEVSYTDDNSLIVRLSAPTSGKAYLN